MIVVANGDEVEVAEGEPLRLGAVRGELGLEAVRLLGPAPPLTLVDTAAQGVEEGVDVGADAQPVEGDVVAGVRDDRDGRVLETGGGVEVVPEPADEAGAAAS